MAMHSGVATSKVLILIGAGLTGSVILRTDRLPDVISELLDLIKGLNVAEISSNNFGSSSLLAAQIRRLAEEVRELTISRPETIFDGDSVSSGRSFTNFIMPTAALGAMGYCYMWWKGWSFSDVMFVTKCNMANAVLNVSKQLEHVSAALSSTKRHLTQRLENLDGKLDEQKEVSKLIMNEVNEMKSDVSQIGFDLEIIQRMVSNLEGKIGLLQNKQDFGNAGIWYLCQFVGGMKEHTAELFQDFPAKFQPERSTLSFSGEKSLKGLQFIAKTLESGEVEKSRINTISHNDFHDKLTKNSIKPGKTKIHRSYPSGISLTGGIRALF